MSGWLEQFITERLWPKSECTGLSDYVTYVLKQNLKDPQQPTCSWHSSSTRDSANAPNSSSCCSVGGPACSLSAWLPELLLLSFPITFSYTCSITFRTWSISLADSRSLKTQFTDLSINAVSWLLNGSTNNEEMIGSFRLNTVRPQCKQEKFNKHVNSVGVYLSQVITLASSTCITMAQKNTIKM